MTLPSITQVADYWANRCLRCDAPTYTCVTCWEKTPPNSEGRRDPDCPHACRDRDHYRYYTFCDSGEPECIACSQFLGVTPDIWEAWTEGGHDLDEDHPVYGRGDFQFKAGLLLMSGDKATVENTAPFCHRCWKYLRPRAVKLDWLCELRDRKATMLKPDTVDQWMPAEVRQFYETGMGAPGMIRASLDDPNRRAEFEAKLEYIGSLSREAFHKRLYEPYLKIPGPSRYISDPMKEKVFERDRGRCVKCGSIRDLQFDHVIPHSRGGSNDAANLQILCGDCNRAKGSGFVS